MSDSTKKLRDGLKTVTHGRHSEAPAKEAGGKYAPVAKKPTQPAQHVRADTMTHQDFHYELGKAGAVDSAAKRWQSGVNADDFGKLSESSHNPGTHMVQAIKGPLSQKKAGDGTPSTWYYFHFNDKNGKYGSSGNPDVDTRLHRDIFEKVAAPQLMKHPRHGGGKPIVYEGITNPGMAIAHGKPNPHFEGNPYLKEQPKEAQVRKLGKASGGKASGMPDNKFDKTQLSMGKKVETEHTSNKNTAKEIAKDHLVEQPKYYNKLRNAGLADELEKSEAAQYHVHLGLDPSRQSTGKYAQWHLTKEQLAHVLKNWDKVKWEMRGSSRPSKEGQHHSTAISRNKLSAPLQGYLDRNEPKGKVLYHGVGRDEVGAKALGADKFDPYHPDEAVRQAPKGPYDEIHSHYTLNVVDKPTGFNILKHIHGLLKPGGKAVVSVRRDLPPPKLQKKVGLS